MKSKSIRQSNRSKLLTLFFVCSTLLSANESRVFFSGNEIVSDNKISEIFRERNINDGIDSLLALYLNEGYPFAEIILDSLTTKGDASLYFFTVNENGRYKIFGVKNQSSVKSSFLEGFLNLKGKKFSYSLIKKKLSELDAYDYLIPNPEFGVEPATDSSVYIVTAIGQNRSSNVSGTLSSDFDSMKLVGYLNLLLISPFGFGDSYKIDYSRLSQENTDLSGGFEFPFLFSSPLGVFAEGEFAGIDSSMSEGFFTAGFFVSMSRFKVKTGFGRSTIFSYDSTSSGSEYSHLYGEMSYVNAENKKINVQMKNNLTSPMSAVLKSYLIWRLERNKFSFETSNSCHFSFTRSYENNMGGWLGGNSNLKSYSEDFILASDYVFIEERFFLSAVKNFNPGLFADMALYRIQKEDALKSFLFSYGIFMGIGGREISMNLYYALNPSLSLIDGRIHLTISYNF
ncbi:MAG: hypothetical protein AB7T10_03720 [bacterium]